MTTASLSAGAVVAATTRRQMLALAGAALACFALPRPPGASATTPEAVEAAIAAFTEGQAPAEGRVSLTAPEIAENGGAVPVSVAVESPMTEADHVVAVLLLADGNPNPGVATFRFSTLSGAAEATTRIRLATSQNVIAIAKMSDGACFRASAPVKVTIGGCGG